MRVVIEC